ncbi:HAD superfamily hydrolase (TIGR01509 family) [Kineococcus xinjiangensis]|uniref:HAD superfamily hydrolase (TIGR01509 family) n=1 Tax=Kineococcus xinjiangensis TaxID=512762 RepID=A0A2S6IVQ2_9ACTN|nr:HAD family phosphatase [Kineococcus xinjiangensis]PPK98428.1 HAD superfamily hydrolase (TIGR01509 family) [Kineococcus xinjiangensis]
MTTQTPVRALLLDADGNLFPSEEPAFVASTAVVNRFLAAHGVDHRYEPEPLRRAAAGRNFRATALLLAGQHGIRVEPGLDAATAGTDADGIPGTAPVLTREALERWVEEERSAVVAHLRSVLQPDAAVLEALNTLVARYEVVVVSSSADARLAACFEATGMAEFFPAERRFSAEDSLPRPVSKPDPAVYLHALERLGLQPHEAVAVEDSVTGTRSAVAAGIRTIGNVLFAAPGERSAHEAELRAVGAAPVVASWAEVVQLLPGPAPREPATH